MPAVVRGGRRQSNKPPAKRSAASKSGGRGRAPRNAQATPDKMAAIGRLDLSPRAVGISIVAGVVVLAGVLATGARADRIGASITEGVDGLAVDALIDRGADAVGARAGGQHPRQDEDAGEERDGDGAGRQVEPTDRRHLVGRGLGVAGRAAPASGFRSRGPLGGLLVTLSPTAANYRGHEASSTIHRTRSL